MKPESQRLHLKKSSRKINLKNTYDILIVGGGVYGAALSYIASKNGYKVLLVEKNDYASGTSSNSLKILHGGIRYLQSLDFIRVVESAKERARLTNIFPNLVRPITCVLPVKTGLIKNKYFIYLALLLFDFIRGIINKRYNVYKHENSKIINRSALVNIFTGISNVKENFGLYWKDSQVVSTERLVYKLNCLAKEAGADTYNYLKYSNAKHDKNKHIVELFDEIAGNKVETSVDVIVDATSSWRINKPGHYKEGSSYISAVNIVVNKRLSEYTVGIPFIKNNINRTLFISPWNNSTLIGTWYFTELEKVDKSTIDECIEDINKYSGCFSINIEDISFIHHGKLPANTIDIKNPYTNVRNQYAILDGISPGVYIVQGVKYTTAMDVAEKTVLKISKYFKAVNKVKPNVNFDGDKFQTVIDYPDTIYNDYDDKITSDTLNRLMELYGPDAEKILMLANANEALLEYVPSSNIVLKAEIEYVLANEEVYCLSDLLLRRTDIGTHAKPDQKMIDYCAKTMATRFNWNSEELHYNYKELDTYYPSWVQQL